MLTRFTRIELMAAVVVSVLAATMALGSRAAVPGIPAIHIDYSDNCTFTMSVDGGFSITSAVPPGPALPPGTYQLLVRFPNPTHGYAPCSRPRFTFTGPGVSSVTEFRGEELVDERVIVLQPSSDFVAEDSNAPAQTRKVFTTAASGSSGVLVNSPAGQQSSPSQGSTQSALVGSAVTRYRGKLFATVDAAGTPTLKFAGRNVRSLKVGKYDINVSDVSARAGFFVQRSGQKTLTVTNGAFVGRKTQRVTLTAGKWAFFSKVGKPVSFLIDE